MSESYRPAPTEDIYAVPRRLLRKGTRSCGECKRRKIRCFFDDPAAPICVGCRRRGTPCVSQEFIDVPAGGGPVDGAATAERLRRVEYMLEKIAGKVLPDEESPGPESTTPGQDQSASGSHRSHETAGAQGHSKDGVTELSNAPICTYDEAIGSDPSRSVHSTTSLIQYSSLGQTLYSHLPPQRDLDLIIGQGRAGLFIQAITNSYHDLFVQGDYHPPKTLSLLPPVQSHPIILARKLIHLALCIQQLPTDYDPKLLTIGASLHSARKRYAEVAQNLVICRDDLVDSLEGLECLCCLGVYQMNDGNLRQALPALRRASVLAQFMGIHRGASIAKVRQHDPNTKLSLQMVWSHLNYYERYVSLLIGMPSPLTKGQFAAQTKPDNETDGEWIEKVHIDICKRIIQRDQDDNRYDLVLTHEIDQRLNQVATSIPPEWWAPLEVTPGMTHADMMSKIISAMSQIIHFNLLTILHMPFLHTSITDHRYDQSKTTCLFACREVLSRFISFRRIVNIVFCCRWVDFTAFTASMTLLLAHLTFPQQMSGWLLAHQRQSDRALVEKAMETMDTLNSLNGDELSRQTSVTVKKLLQLEATSATAGDTFQSSIPDHEGIVLGEDFRLDVPYFGSISLIRARSPVPSTGYASWSQPHSSSPAHTSDGIPMSTMPIPHPAVTPASASGLFEASHMMSHHSLQALPVGPHTAVPLTQPFNITYESVYATAAGEQPQADLVMTDLMASGDEWAFQGVDAAFFESFLPNQMRPS